MQEVVKLSLVQFGSIYLLLILVLSIMKKSRINQTKLLFLSSLRMTLQLVLAGFVLTYIFKNPHPLFTVLYLLSMVSFSTYRVLSKSPDLNPSFKRIIGLSIFGCGIFVVGFFVLGVVRISFFNPQYTIPISGMIIGNAMTGLNLALKTFQDKVSSDVNRIETLTNIGVSPRKILVPYINSSLETALLPTLNSMLSMGIISLPGMMTGQILSGTLPMTAIMYQIAIMIAICTSVCLTVFVALNLGYKTLFDRNQRVSI